MMRILIIILLTTFSGLVLAQNNEMFKQKRERKRLWRRHHGDKERSNGTAYNPYLEKSAKNKPSARIALGDKRELRQQKRAARKQLRKSRRKVND